MRVGLRMPIVSFGLGLVVLLAVAAYERYRAWKACGGARCPRCHDSRRLWFLPTHGWVVCPDCERG